MKKRQFWEGRHRLGKIQGFILFISFFALIFTFSMLRSITKSDDRAFNPDQGNEATKAITTYKNNGNYAVRFVMFLGIEGTGHHLWQDLIKESPTFSRLKDIGLHPQFTKKLTKHLYRHKKERWNGLWSSTCKWDENNDPSPNVTSILSNLINTLQDINSHAGKQEQQQNEYNGPVTFPVNLLPGGGNEFGVISYPGFSKPCRVQNYPNLDVWYQACDAARVLCEHVYIYRNPYSVVRSTTENRHFNKDKMEAIHLYTTQLHILHSQLLQFQDKVIGCWDYDASLSPLHYKNEIEPVLQFREERLFADALKKVFSPKPKLTEHEKKQIIPAELDGYMKSMEHIHDLVVQTCSNLGRNI